MKKRIFLFIIIPTLILSLISCVPPFQSDTFLTTTSPNKSYTVELNGNKSAPSLPFIDHEVRFSLSKSGQTIINNAFVDRFDCFDSDFGEMYSENKWINKSILRFGTDVSKSEKSSDTLVVSNQTSQTIKYLRIVARDMIFIFEMLPNSKNEFSIPHLGDLPWIAAEGEFANGQRIEQDGVNFQNKDKLKNSLSYCISVSNNGLKIESPNMDTYDGNGNS